MLVGKLKGSWILMHEVILSHSITAAQPQGFNPLLSRTNLPPNEERAAYAEAGWRRELAPGSYRVIRTNDRQ